MGLLFIVVLQRTLKGKTQKPSSPMLMGHGKGEHTVLSPFNFSRNEKGEGKAGVTGRESFVFQQSIVLEFLSSQHNFFMPFSLQVYKNDGEPFSIWIAQGDREWRKKQVSILISASLGLFIHRAICSHRKNRRKAVASMPLGKSKG